MIRIWKFVDAPPHLKLHPPSLSDVDRAWVMLVPASMEDAVEAILPNLTAATDIFRDRLTNGTIVISGLYTTPTSSKVKMNHSETNPCETQG
jgi:hypothetical protein